MLTRFLPRVAATLVFRGFLALAVLCGLAAAQNNAGSVAVGQSVPMTASVQIRHAGTGASLAVVTQGATGLDFSGPASGYCNATFSVGAICTVPVTFSPKSPGERLGAVVVKDGGGNVLGTGYLTGIGLAPLGLFTAPTAAWTQTAANGAAFNQPRGLSADGNGNVYFLDTANGRLIEVPKGGGTPLVLASGISSYDGGATAVDGAGNIFVSSNNSGASTDGIYELENGSLANSDFVALQTPDDNLTADGAGNLYLTAGSGTNAGIYVVSASTRQVTELYKYTSGQRFIGLAVDPAGNIFAADYGSNVLYELPVANQLPNGNGQLVTLVSNVYANASGPHSVAVDPAGNIYVGGLNSSNSDIYRYSCTGLPSAPSCRATILPATGTASLAIDGLGNLYAVSGNSVVAYSRTLAPAVTFAATAYGATAATPATEPIEFENDGNVGLAVTSDAATANFGAAGPGNTCATGTLDVGASCQIVASFTPRAVGGLAGQLTLTDNTLGIVGTQQSAALAGTAVQAQLTVTASSPAATYGAVSAVTPIYAGFQFSDSPDSLATQPTCATTQTATTAAGTAYASSCSGGASANYTFHYVNGGATVGKAPLTVTASSASFAQGATPPAITPTYAGFLNGDGAGVVSGLACGTTATSASGGGSYPSYCSGGVATNYSLSYNGGTVTVTVTPASYTAPATTVGQTSAARAANVLFTGSTTVGSIAVVTQGLTGLDFNPVAGGTCLVGQNYSAGQSCQVDYTFTPATAGERLGAVRLYDQNGNPIATEYLSGIGVGAMAGYSGGAVTTYTAPAATGVVVDAQGTVYVVSSAGVEVFPHGNLGSPTTYAVEGINGPQGAAMDGAGNLYIANSGGKSVVRVPNLNGTLQYGNTTVIAGGSGTGNQHDLAVDEQGNVFVSTSGTPNALLFEIPVGTSTEHQITTLPGTNTQGLEFGTDGNLYLTMYDTGNIVEVVNPESSPSVVVAASPGSNPYALGVDGNGDLYYDLAATGNIYRVGNVGGTLQFGSPVLVGNVASARQIAMDAAGNLYVVSDKGNLTVINQSAPPAQSYPELFVGQSSATQSEALANIGNSGLSFNSISYDANFPNQASSCGSGTLNAGASCAFTTDFAPRVAGNPVNGTLSISDNAVNESGAQTIAQSGMALSATQTITFSLASPVTYGTGPISLSATGGASGNPVAFSIISGAAFGTLSGANNSLLTVTGAGTITIEASQAAGNGYLAASPVDATLVVAPAPKAISFQLLATPVTVNATGTLSATASNGDPVVYTVTAGSVSIAGTTATFTNAGSVTITASSPASANYAAATPVAQTVTVNPEPVSYVAPELSADQTSGVQVAYVNFTTGGTLGSVGVVTQGATGLDFNPAGNDTCVVGQAYTAGQACEVDYTFSPKSPGQRQGGIVLKDAAGNLLGVSYLGGVGDGPLGLFSSPTASWTVTSTGNFAFARGISVDGHGNVYFASTGGTQGLYEIPAGSTTAVLIAATSVSGGGTAVDGAGNVYLASVIQSKIFELVNGQLKPLALSLTFAPDDNLEVDGAGNLYSSDYNTGAIYEIPAGGTSVQTVIAGGAGRRFIGLAVDPAGDIFAPDFNNNILYEIKAGSNTLTQLSIGGLLDNPHAVAVDPAGNVYVANYNGPSNIVRYAASTWQASALPATGSRSLVLDGQGNIYAGTDSTIAEYSRLTPPTVQFPSTVYGQTSTAAAVAFENDGNAPLVVSSYAASANFGAAGSGNTCAAGTMPVGANCSIVATFTPTLVASSIPGTLVISDNSSAGGTQTLNLAGGSTQAPATIQVTGYSLSYDGAAHKATGTATGVSGVDLSAGLNLAPTSHTNAGTYVDTWTFHDASGDYADASGTTHDAIAATAVAVTASSPTFTYGTATPPQVAPSYAGFVNGETASVLTAAPVCIPNLTASTNAGTYPTSCSGAGAANYTFTYVAGTATVNAATATVTVTPYNVIYNGAAHTATGVASGVGGASLPASDFTLGGTTHTGAGSYATDAWSFHDANYVAANGTVSDAISPAVATVTASSPSFTYGTATPPQVAPSYAGFVNGESASVLTATPVCTPALSAATNAGTYPTACSGAAAANYTFTYVAGTARVNPAIASVNVTPYSVTYDGVAHTATGTATGIAGASLGADLNLAATSHTNAGTYNGDTWSFHDPNGNYSDASGAVNDAISPAPNVITFAPLPTPVTVNAAGALSASSSSGIAVTLTVTGGTAGINGTTVTYSNAGPVTITASAAASANYSTAAPVAQTVTVNPEPISYGAPETSAGQTSGVQVAYVNFTTGGTLGRVGVVTQGAAELDFRAAGNDTCVVGQAYTVGQACEVDYTFSPTTAGERQGGIVLKDGSGNVLGTSYLGGIGDGAVGLFTSPTPSWTVAANVPRGLSFDGGGDVFWNDAYTYQLLEVKAGTSSVVSLGTTTPGYASGGTAVDGAGNVYMTADDPNQSGVLYEMVNGSLQRVITGLPSVGDNLVVDGAGNLYFSVQNGTIEKIPAGTKAATPIFTGNGQSFIGLAIDPAGDLFTANFSNNTLYELKAGASSMTTLASNDAHLNHPHAVALDAAGNVYVSNIGGGGIMRYAANTWQETTLPAAGRTALAVDGQGDIYAASDDSHITKYSRSLPPALAFPSTIYGQTSTAPTVEFENDGNANLVISSYGASANFGAAGSGNTCAVGTMAVGASCSVVATFTPETAANPILGTLTISDNSVNGTSQVLSLQGTSTQVPPTIQVTGYGVTYDGAAHKATGTATGLNGLDLGADLNLSSTAHTNAGTYNGDTWSFHDPSGAYADASGAVNDAISPTAVTVTASSPTFTFGTATPPQVAPSYAGFANGETASVLTAAPVCTPALTAGTNAGTYPTACSGAGAVNYTFTYVAGTATVNPATATVTVTPYNVTYNGAAHIATGVATGVGGASLPASDLTLSGTTHTGAGTYAADAWSFRDANYVAANGTVSDTISPAVATVTASSPTFTYGMATPPQVAASFAGFVNGETATVLTAAPVCTPALTAGTNAGTYPTACNGAAAANYTFAYVAGTATVNPATATVTVTPYTVTYDGAAHTATGVATGVGGVSLPAADLTLTGTTHTAAGTFAADAWSFRDANYVAANGTVSDAISPAAVTVTASSPTFTYGTAAPPQVAASFAGFVNGDTASLLTAAPVCTPALTAGTNAGTYPTACSGAAAANYTFTYVAGTATVNPATATVTVTPYTVTYDGTAHTATGVATGVGGVSLPAADLTLTGTTHTAAGTFAADAWSFRDANYVAANGTVSDTISPAAVTVTASSPTFTYGTATPPQVAASYAGFINGQSAAVLTAAPVCTPALSAGTNAGTYPTACSGAAAANYTFTYVAGTATVNPATASVTVTPYTVTYDGAAHTATGAATGVGGVSLPATDLTLTGTTHTASGSFAADAWSFRDPNYVAANGTVNDTISPAAVTVTASSPTYTYGMATPPQVAASFAGFVNGDTASVLTAAPVCTPALSAATNAGTYPTACSGAAAANYTFSYVPGTATVNAATASVTVTPYSVTYDGTAHTATATATGVGGVSLPASDLILSGTSHSNAGTYANDAWSFSDPNYVAANGTVSDAISAAAVTVTASSPTFTYGTATPPQVAASYAGFANGESASVLTATPVCTPALSATTNAGTYPTACSGAAAANYTFSYVPGTATVTQAAASITVTPYTVTFDGAAHTATGIATGVNSADLGADLSLTGTTHANAGTYASDAWSFHDPNGNYADASGTSSDTINKAAAIVTVTPYSVTYDGTAHTATGTVTGVGGASLTGLDLSGTTHTSAGTYASDNWAFTDANGNYSNTTGTVSDAIAKADPKLAWGAPAAITYGTPLGGAQLNATSGGLAGSFAYTPAAGTVLAAGNQTLKAVFTPTDATDYNSANASVSLTVNTAALTITAGSQTLAYGATPAAVPAAYTGLVNGDGAAQFSTPPTCSTTATNTSIPGSYPTSCAGAVDPNYAISYVNGTATVVPATLVIAANPVSCVYGTCDGDNDRDDIVKTGYTVTGLANGQTAAQVLFGRPRETANVPEEQAAAVGTYPISMSQGWLRLNPAYANLYTLSYAGSTYTITPATLTVTANSQSDVYGQTDSDRCGHVERHLGYTISGYAWGENAWQLLRGTPALATTATGDSNAGSYPVTVSAGTLQLVGPYASNYTIVYVNGALTVTPAQLTVVANSYSRPVNTANPAFGYAVSGFVNGDTQATALAGAPTIATAAGTTSPAGNYVIAIGPGSLAAQNGNYTLNFVNGELIVYNPNDRDDQHCDGHGNYRPNPGYDCARWQDGHSYNFYWGGGRQGPNVIPCNQGGHNQADQGGHGDQDHNGGGDGWGH